MPSVNLSNGSVHYTETGQGAPLILLHANPGDSHDFDAIIPALAERYRVLALDWPGYGQSPLPARPDTLGAGFFCSVLREFVAALDLPPVILVGNSLGGFAAARLALDQPQQVRALVLVSPGGFTPHNLITRSFCKMQGSRLALSPRGWAGRCLKEQTPTTRGMLERAGTSQSSSPLLALNRSVWRSFIQPDHDLRAVAAGIKAPTLMVFGARDPAIPASKDGKVAARCMPAAQIQILPCGHAAFAEMPADFLAQVLPFLERNAG